MTMLKSKPPIPTSPLLYEKFTGDNYRWASGGGGLYQLKDMETTHLFYTLRLVWNYLVKHDEYIMIPHPQGKKVSFPKSYTIAYLVETVCRIIGELKSRCDRSVEIEVQQQRVEQNLPHLFFLHSITLDEHYSGMLKASNPPPEVHLNIEGLL